MGQDASGGLSKISSSFSLLKTSQDYIFHLVAHLIKSCLLLLYLFTYRQSCKKGEKESYQQSEMEISLPEKCDLVVYIVHFYPFIPTQLALINQRSFNQNWIRRDYTALQSVTFIQRINKYTRLIYIVTYIKHTTQLKYISTVSSFELTA